MTLTVGGGRGAQNCRKVRYAIGKWGKAGEGRDGAVVDLLLFNGNPTLHPCSHRTHTQSVSRNDDAPLIWPLFRESSFYLSVSAVCMFTHFHLRTGAYRTFMLAHREREGDAFVCQQLVEAYAPTNMPSTHGESNKDGPRGITSPFSAKVETTLTHQSPNLHNTQVSKQSGCIISFDIRYLFTLSAL